MNKERKIEVHQSTISRRWAFYIDGERCGSAPTKDGALQTAKELIQKMDRDENKSVTGAE